MIRFQIRLQVSPLGPPQGPPLLCVRFHGRMQEHNIYCEDVINYGCSVSLQTHKHVPPSVTRLRIAKQCSDTQERREEAAGADPGACICRVVKITGGQRESVFSDPRSLLVYKNQLWPCFGIRPGSTTGPALVTPCALPGPTLNGHWTQPEPFETSHWTCHLTNNWTCSWTQPSPTGPTHGPTCPGLACETNINPP